MPWHIEVLILSLSSDDRTLTVKPQLIICAALFVYRLNIFPPKFELFPEQKFVGVYAFTQTQQTGKYVLIHTWDPSHIIISQDGSPTARLVV